MSILENNKNTMMERFTESVKQYVRKEVELIKNEELEKLQKELNDKFNAMADNIALSVCSRYKIYSNENNIVIEVIKDKEFYKGGQKC